MRKKVFVIMMIFSKFLFANAVLVQEMAEKPTFRIVNLAASGTGSGFVINKEGYLITNNHVVKGYEDGKLLVINNFEKFTNIKVIKTYPKKDIAILKIEGYHGKYFLELANPKSIKVGIDSFSYGYPGGSDTFGSSQAVITATIKQGIVSKIIKTADDEKKFVSNYKIIETSSFMNGGNSGGPLLGMTGTVIGINTVKNSDLYTLARSGEVTQGIFWAIHIEELIKVLKENDIPFTISDRSLDEHSSGNIIYIVLFVIIIAILIAIFYILLKNKKSENKIDEREVSLLVKDKFEKYSNLNKKKSNNIVEDSRETKLAIRLKPEDSKLPVIRTQDKKPVVVGRSKSCDIVISNRYVSKKHIKVTIEGVKVEIEDLNSTNGTYIDGKKLLPNNKVRLQRGERLILGSEDVVYKIS